MTFYTSFGTLAVAHNAVSMVAPKKPSIATCTLHTDDPRNGCNQQASEKLTNTTHSKASDY